MAISFWINVLICVASIWNAWLDHGQSWIDYKSITWKSRKEKSKKLQKLVLLWAIPILSFAVLPITWEESKSKPIHERIMAAINDIDPAILTDLKTNTSANVNGCRWFDRRLSQAQHAALWKLDSESGAHEFFGMSTVDIPFFKAEFTGVFVEGVKFVIFTNIFDGSTKKPLVIK